MGSITSQNLSFDEQGQIIVQEKETPVIKKEIKKEITKEKK